MNNQQFIDGSWYEKEYQDGWYGHTYIKTDEPEWASQAKDYYIALMVAYGGLKPDMSILDLGSGVGSAIRAWKRLGFQNVTGIEISQTAIRASGENIIQGTVWDLPWEDGAFDVVSSFALFEHIDENYVRKAIDECFRVGKSQFHTVAHESGTDPSHINVKTPEEWFNYFLNVCGNREWIVCELPDVLYTINPMIVAIQGDRVPRPLRDALTQKGEP